MGGVLLYLLILFTIISFGCDDLGITVDDLGITVDDTLNILGIDGRFVDGSSREELFISAENKTLTFNSSKLKESNDINDLETLTYTVPFSIKNNKIVTEKTAINAIYWVEGNTYENDDCLLSYEISINPEDITTIVVKRMSERQNEEKATLTNTDIYVPIESQVSFDGTWQYGNKKLLIKGDKCILLNSTGTAIECGGIVYDYDRDENVILINIEYSIEENNFNVDSINGALAKSNKIYGLKHNTKTGTFEDIILTKISDSVDPGLSVPNKYLGKYKSSNNDFIQITNTTIYITPGDYSRPLNDGTHLKLRATEFAYPFDIFKMYDDIVVEKDMRFDVVEWNEETGEEEIVDTRIYTGQYRISKNTEILYFTAYYGDIYSWDISATKYKTGTVDFSGTWILTKKMYDGFQGNLVFLTINNDGSWSLKIDGTEKNTEDYTIDLESSNGDNLLKCYLLTGIITETNKLLLQFPYKQEGDVTYLTSALFVKQ